MLHQVSTVLNEVLPRRKGHDFLLSYLLALYPMLQIEPPQGSDSYSFVSEFPVEIDCSLLHGDPGPPLERNRRDQEVYVLLIKLPHKLFAG